jgi:hypothetical protein
MNLTTSNRHKPRLEVQRIGHIFSDSAAEPPRGQATRAFPLLAPKAPGRSGHGPGIGEAKGPAYPLGLLVSAADRDVKA